MAIPSALSVGSCIGGVPITLHYSFFLLLLVEFLYSIRYTQTTPPHSIFVLYIVVFYGPVLLCTILVHEFGHALATKKLGGSVGGIVLWPLGGYTICGPTETLADDLKVALAGPVTHVPMGFVWWAIYAALAGREYGFWPSSTIYLDVVSNGAVGFFETLSAQALYLNIVLFIFNLFIPAYPLDGGRIYAATLMLAFKLRGPAAARVTAITAMLLSSGMIVYALISMFKNDSGSQALLGIVGVFVFYQGTELLNAARRDELGNHPIFGRKCYRDNDGDADAGAEGGREAGPVPAQTDDAVLA